MSRAERLQAVAEFTEETYKVSGDPKDRTTLEVSELSPELAERMIENVIGVYGLPLGIAANFQLNGRDYLIPMAIEEPSVVAGASFAARLVRDGGGFQTQSDEPLMIGQVQILDIADPHAARFRLLAAKQEIMALANRQDPVIIKLGGGARDLEVRVLENTPVGAMLVAHLIYDVRDAMGANTINTALEAIAPLLARISGGRTRLRILSNLADRRLARAKGVVPVASLAQEGFSGEDVAQGIVEAYAFAAADPYRATTHNKGIMNGVDALVIATGNDWRAIEAGAHAYAARGGRYTSLSRWERDASGNLVGSLEMPMALGIVGGATKVHPTAKLALKILGVQSARELAEAAVALGLAQNLAALRALAAEGIQRGHMALHARQVALSIGAPAEQIDAIVARMVSEKAVRPDRALEILKELQ
jgi:hydroxymethylglutaryl-CoA reductase